MMSGDSVKAHDTSTSVGELISCAMAFASSTHRQSGKLVPLCVLVCVLVLLASGCSEQSDSGQVRVNAPSGVQLPAPAFLSSRAIIQSNIDARVKLTIEGVDYPAQRNNTSPGDTTWVGDVFVPPGSDATLSVEWVETGVVGLPSELDGELMLASHTSVITGINTNRAIQIAAGDYDINSSPEKPLPALDIDGDNFGNLEERMEGSNANNFNSTPPADVVILYNPNAPVIDGSYDSIWQTAQFQDQARQDLNIDNILVDNQVTPVAEDRRYRWAAMHDGQYLYVAVFAEASGQQTPFSDSTEAYNDDAVDIYWDGNDSKGTAYDGVDDHQVIIALLSTDGQGSANRSGQPNTRFELGDRSAPISATALEFATCLCSTEGEQQLYEIKLDLQAAKIPIDRIFGFDIQLNNDELGGPRDTKWAWHNDTGMDDTWRFPIRMGSARLEPVPQ